MTQLRNYRSTSKDKGFPVTLPTGQPGRPLRGLIGSYLLTVPVPIPVNKPSIERADCEGNFFHRFGAAAIYSGHAFQYILSPSGEAGAIAKLFLRWFSFFLVLSIAIGTLALLIAQFTVGVSNLLYRAAGYLNLAAQELFQAVIYVVSACALLAVTVTMILFLIRRWSRI